jgi:hypothetical protein
MILGHKSTGYMCLTAFEHDFEGDCGGTKVYPSLEALQENHKCLAQCGIVEVEVKAVRIVQDPDWSVEGLADRTFEPIYEFQRLTRQWKKETFLCSSVNALEQHPAMRKIVGMGKKAVPLIMVSLEGESAWWFGALRELTGINPVPAEDSGRVRQMREHWLKWWAENKETWLALREMARLKR